MTFQRDTRVYEVLPPAEEDRRDRLVGRLRDRQEVQRHQPYDPGKPRHEPPDVRGRWGRRSESAPLQRHHSEMDAVYYAKQKAGYVQAAGVHLEYETFTSSVETVAAEEALLLQTQPQSAAAMVAEQLFLDSVERLRVLANDNQEAFRQRALGGR